jgi:hypothetical protein
MTTESDDEYEPDAQQAHDPAINGVPDEPPQDTTNNDTSVTDSNRLQWLMPDDSDTDNDGRTGLLSTRVEWHALILGGTVGTMAAHSGDFSTVAAIVGAGAAGSRAQVGLPDEYVQQAKKELPYFAAGVLIGYVAVRYDVLAGTGIGVW